MSKPQIWTVVQIAEGDTLPWNKSYRNVEAAIAEMHKEHNAVWHGDKDKPEISRNEFLYETNCSGQLVFESENDDVWVFTPTDLV